MMHSHAKTRHASLCSVSLTNAPIHNVFMAGCLKEAAMATAWRGHERGYWEGCKIQNLNEYDNREQSRCHTRLYRPHNNICRFHTITRSAGKHLRLHLSNSSQWWVTSGCIITVSAADWGRLIGVCKAWCKQS